MKIVQINAVGQSMSTGRACKELQDYINEFTVHTCYTAFAQGKEDEFSFRIGTRSEWKIHGFLSRLTGRQAYFSKRGTKKLLIRLNEIKPDVLVLGNLHGNYINFPILMKYIAQNKISTVLVLHDCWFYTGKCTHYTSCKCYKWKTGCGNCPRLKKDNPSWRVDATADLWSEKKRLFEALPSLAVVGVSDWIANEAKGSFLCCAEEIIRIYNWVDMEIFSPQENYESIRREKGLSDKKIILGVASNWTAGKGLPFFIDLKEKLDQTYCVILLGKIDNQDNLPEGIVHISGTQSMQELAMYYNIANVFVTMSLEESFGKVSAEALACGTPVVCFDSTANRELVGEGCGEVIEAENLIQMKNAIINICSQDKSKYRKKCREFALEHFAKEDRIQDYIKLFEKLWNNRENLLCEQRNGNENCIYI